MPEIAVVIGCGDALKFESWLLQEQATVAPSLMGSGPGAAAMTSNSPSDPRRRQSPAAAPAQPVLKVEPVAAPTATAVAPPAAGARALPGQSVLQQLTATAP